MRTAFVHGLGFWTTGHATPASWLGGIADPEISKPEAGLLQGPLRRRAPPLTRMSIEVLEQAVREAGREPSGVRSVFATAHGEHTPAIRLLQMMQRGEGKLSPTHFHNSVHNTASGYASIATSNTAASTTLTGGSELVPSALLEALALATAFEEDVVLVLADEPLLPPFERAAAAAPLALAFFLSRREEGAIAALSGLRRDRVSPVKPSERFGSLYVSAGLPLLERIAAARPGTVPLELEGTSGEHVWCVDVELAAG